MPLTGIEIFKLLPKTNCGDCGVPTCLAFAMALTDGKAELTKCPHVSEEAKSKLSEASAPPILPVTIGTGDAALKVSGETVMFRHEKTFVNQPGIALLIKDTMDDAAVDTRLKKLDDLQYERVGLTLACGTGAGATAAVARAWDPGGDDVVVAVTVTLEGSYLGVRVDGRYRYLRVWKRVSGAWRVIAGSVVSMGPV